MVKILAIDDEIENLIALKDVICDYIPDCKFIIAQSGPEGLEKTKKELPDTILLDIKMPAMDGWEVCRELKGDEHTKHIPVIMETIITDTKELIKTLDIGADAFLSKPLEPGKLIAQINVMLRIKSAEDKLRKENVQLEDLVQTRTKKYLESEKNFGMLFDTIPDSVFIINNIEFIIECNKASTLLYGYSKEELICKQITDFLNPPDSQMFSKKVAMLDQFEPTQKEIQIYNKDGNKIDIWRKTVPLENASGKPEFILIYDRELTKQKNMNKVMQNSINNNNKRMKEINFLYNFADLIEKPEISLEDIIQKIIELIPSACQYSEITCVRVFLYNKEFTTDHFSETIWKEVVDIIIKEERVGRLEVSYSEEKLDSTGVAFLQEERKLFYFIANQLGRIIEKKNPNNLR